MVLELTGTLPVFIYNIIGETLTSNTHRAIISEYWASLLRLRNITNKSESSNYTANGDLAIKSGFVNVVSSAILNSQAGTAVRSFPDSRSPFPVPSFSNIHTLGQLVLQIWMNTYVNPAELGGNQSSILCLSCCWKELVFLHVLKRKA